MKAKAMDKLVRHLNTYFEQDDCMVSHPVVDNGFHVDILVYKPNEKYPFWKLVSMGASDYKMPKIDNTLGLYNEYMMFVDPDVDLEDKQILAWYHNMLSMIASYPYFTHTHVTYSHSLEWAQEDPGEEMIGAFIEFPQTPVCFVVNWACSRRSPACRLSCLIGQSLTKEWRSALRPSATICILRMAARHIFFRNGTEAKSFNVGFFPWRIAQYLA